MARMTLVLNDVEQRALVQLAQKEVRTPRDQAYFILRQHLAQETSDLQETQPAYTPDKVACE